MYLFDSLPEVREQSGALPVEALSFYAELIVFLELTPWEGQPYNKNEPNGVMRSQAFGPKEEGLAVYLVLEHQRRVVMLSVTWIG